MCMYSVHIYVADLSKVFSPMFDSLRLGLDDFGQKENPDCFFRKFNFRLIYFSTKTPKDNGVCSHRSWRSPSFLFTLAHDFFLVFANSLGAPPPVHVVVKYKLAWFVFSVSVKHLTASHRNQLNSAAESVTPSAREKWSKTFV